MKRLLALFVGVLLVSSIGSAQMRGGPGDRDRGGDRGSDQRGGDQRPGDQRPGDQRPGDQRPGDQRPGGQRPGGDQFSSSKDYAGSIEAGNMCMTCALENRADVPRPGKKERYLLNNDRDSLDARCQELGWQFGQALELFSHNEWCKYGNARTRTWDRFARRWTFGSCTPGNVKLARCYNR